jgi:hypothetical protein
MNRRNFFGLMVGGLAASAAVRTWPFRVFSFPSEIRIGQTYDDLYDLWHGRVRPPWRLGMAVSAPELSYPGILYQRTAENLWLGLERAPNHITAVANPQQAAAIEKLQRVLQMRPALKRR